MASSALDSTNAQSLGHEDELASAAIKRPLPKPDPEPDPDPEPEPEPEAGHAKKRRKQSRPVRLAATPTLQEGKTGIGSILNAAEHESEGEVEGDGDLHSLLQQHHQQVQQKGTLEEFLQGPDIPLNLSSLPRSGSASPIDFVVGSWPDRADKSDEAGHGTKRYIPIAPPFLLPLPSLPSAAGNTPIRIFNPDAYCELCNKEFCNKYFLKTHKANKHGIYVENSVVALGGSPYAGSFITTDVGMTPISSAVNKTSPSLSKSVELGNAVKYGGNGTMRAFCDICQKKFCNKYFVRRHKAKIHGIVDDSPAPSGYNFSFGECIRKIDFDEPSSVSMGSDAGSNIMDAPLSEVAVNTLESEEPRASTSEKTDSNSLMCTKLSPVHSTADETPDTALTNVKPEPESERGQEQEPEPERDLEQLSPTPSQQARETMFSSDRLRKLGVINADAFCEICCKEYCNKYFLRTHKLKRHGILVPDNDGRPLGALGSAVPGVGAQQSSPLNLIVGEQGASSSDSGLEDPECEICGRRFQNLYLLQMHRTYLHVVDKTSGNNNNGGSDNISEDLQKLQTMILQLNNLNVSKATACSICNKDLENERCLRAHMVAEHGVLLDEASSSPPPLIDPQTFCFICKKDFFTKYFLKQHMDECHVPTATVPTASSSLPETQDSAESSHQTQPNQPLQQTGIEKRVSVTPTSSYCEICNKELCNKYFMKTHMQRMHGIEIENGAQIGGVICDICNKELCSKYFLRVHKQNTHGIVEDGPRDGTVTTTPSTPVTENDPALKPCELGDLTHRYFSHFTEVCPLCSRRFRSSKWLKAHLLNDHGQAGADKWKDLEGQSQQNRQQCKATSTMDASTSHSPTLKIPTSWGSRDAEAGSQQAQQECGEHSSDVGSKQVFSSLFGTGDSAVKNYHCSYCSFSTPVLAFLFVHERSHTGLSSQQIPGPTKPFQCPVCFQSFLQGEVFQHHILTHQFSGLLNPFFPPSSSGAYTAPLSKTLQSLHALPRSPENPEEAEKSKESPSDTASVTEDESSTSGTTKCKFRCSQCFQRFKSRELCLAHVQSKHSLSSPNASSSSEASKVKANPQGLYKCTQCGFSSVHMILLKKHIRKEHEDDNSRSEKSSELQEVKKKLQEAARKSQVPASYAVPQSLGRFIMQPFLLEEPGALAVAARDANFVPSLVFLPVREKLSAPLTVAFTLTPA